MEEEFDVISELELVLAWMTQDDVSIIFCPHVGLGFWLDYENDLNIIFIDPSNAEESLEYIKQIQKKSKKPAAFLLDLEGNFALDFLIYQYQENITEIDELLDYVAFKCGLEDETQVYQFMSQDYCVIGQLSDGTKLDLPQLIEDVEANDEI